MGKNVSPEVEAALRQMESTALNFAYQFINISSVRSAYIAKTQDVSRYLKRAYLEGEMSAKAAAEAAHGLRNQIMEQQRAKSAALGRAMASNLKAKGVALDAILAKVAKQAFKKPFADLDNAQQTAVFMEVVESAGRPRSSASKSAARAGAAGRALFVLGIGIAVYNIANAQDKSWQAGREVSNIGGGMSGSIAAGALAGIWFGPLGVAIGAFVGGVAGALIADQAYVATVGASNAKAAQFLKRFTTFFGTDETGIANALYTEVGIDMDRVHEVFCAMEESFTTDADDVAVLYLEIVFSRKGNVLEALRLNKTCRNTLVRILDDGPTFSDEISMINKIKDL